MAATVCKRDICQHENGCPWNFILLENNLILVFLTGQCEVSVESQCAHNHITKEPNSTWKGKFN